MKLTAKISGSVFSIDPIYSPDGYARTVFQENIDNVQYEVNGNEPMFTYRQMITLDGEYNLQSLVKNIVPDSTNGRKVTINVTLEN